MNAVKQRYFGESRFSDFHQYMIFILYYPQKNG